ncbi:MAG: hypothetical protein NTV93_06880 [Verrucomicrobia bacterium]|nr:hypothetical protein [Verrucomicrobiota bacterium]
MKNFRQSIRMAGAAAKANLLPGLLLQCLMLAFFSLYIAHEGTRHFLGEVAAVKQEAGYGFSFLSYVIAGAVLPELLRIAFFQSGKPTRRNLWLLLTAAPFWGLLGVIIDLLYRLQAVWFGTGHDWFTLLRKVLVDQFLFAPIISAPLIVGWFLLRDEGFRPSAFRKIFRVDFFPDKVFPVVVAGWCVWIPGVILVYSMPPLLQIPVAVFIQVFWVLIFTTMEESMRRKT